MRTGQKKITEIAKEFVKPFNLKNAPLLRVTLVKMEKKKHVLMFDMHHIISDGTSMGILVEEFAALYNGEELPALRIQYKDFSAWQNEIFRTGKIKKQETYWSNMFAGEMPVLNIPLDHKREGVRTFTGNTVSYIVPDHLTKKLEIISKKQNTTLNSIIYAIYTLLLNKYTGQQEIVVGSLVAGRGHSDLENVVGVFINFLPILNHIYPNQTFREFLNTTAGKVLEAYENQDYPFEKILENLNYERDPSRHPLLETMVNFHNENELRTKTSMKEIRFEYFGEDWERNISTLDFWLEVRKNKLEELICFLKYDTDLFDRTTMERFLEHFKNLTERIVEDPEQKLPEIDMLSESEKKRILIDFNNTKTEYPNDRTIHELFEEQVERTPDKTAVVFEEKRLTYRELNEKANQLAKVLREKGIKPDSLVGIMVERSLEMMVGIIAVLKAGGAYVPIDPDYPAERIKYIIEDSEVKVFLTQKSFINGILANRTAIDLEEEMISRGKFTVIPKTAAPENLAYVIYTSGSTGKPKGVMVEHRNVVSYVHAFTRETGIHENDIMLQQASYSFDVFIEEVFPMLLRGGSIVIPKRFEVMDVNLLSKILLKNKVTMVSCSPLLLNELNRLPLVKTIHTYISGGDILKTEYITNIIKDSPIYNTYGPTETTVCATYYRPGKNGNTGMSIGKPIANYKIYILDRDQNILPIGIPGELYISGNGVTRGYLNQPELTAEKFVPNPFNLQTSKFTPHTSRMYRTGDLAKWLPDGNIEFLGRIDHQVKIRGFRIELEEIESRLLKLEAIKEAIVIAKEDWQGHQYLAAYIAGERELPVATLREHLLKELPGYMIPSYFIRLKKLPLTPNGKVDRKALPEPEGNIHPSLEYEAPTNDLEQKLVEIWQEVLHIGEMGINDDFFEMGGHSLKATALVTKIHQEFEVELTLREVFQNPTIKDLARQIRGAAISGFYAIPPVTRGNTIRYHPRKKECTF